MNKKEIIEKLKTWITETKVINYDEEIGLKCKDKENELLRDNKTEKEVYIISFKTKDVEEYDENGQLNMFIEGKYCFAYYDAENLELLYILTSSGYIETDGTY